MKIFSIGTFQNLPNTLNKFRKFPHLRIFRKKLSITILFFFLKKIHHWLYFEYIQQVDNCHVQLSSQLFIFFFL